MSTFRDYFSECVAQSSDIRITREYLDIMPFEDVCLVIHHISKRHEPAVLLSEMNTSMFNDLHRSGTIRFNEGMTEHFALLIFVLFWSDHSRIKLVKEDGSGPYKMSRGIAEAAAICHMLDNPFIQKIYCAFKIPYDDQLATEYFNNHYSPVKSARNVA